ncbi:MAG: HAD-IB family phosphatase [Methylovulum sp.]|jgi:phosphoserine phosphatase|nr:HAD-IB family phosphatase [Methylovulum sp.]
MSFAIICFDCDSTLSKIEGIDELAKRAGLGDAMSALTEAAMNGSVPLEAVYAKRLALIKPSCADLNWLADVYIAEQIDDIHEVFSRLIAQDKQLHIISGGLRPAILPLAKALGVPAEHVHAVDIYFNQDGSYHDYEQHSPLARNGGKATVVKALAQRGKVVMIGDGITDMEAKQAGAYTIGFGGVVLREAVKQSADVYVTTPSLLGVLAHLQ